MRASLLGSLCLVLGACACANSQQLEAEARTHQMRIVRPIGAAAGRGMILAEDNVFEGHPSSE